MNQTRTTTNFFETKIEFLKGVGPQRAETLNKQLNIFTFGELIQYYPFRYEDRSRFHHINELTEDMPAAQLKGRIRGMVVVGEGHKRRLTVEFTDGTGVVEFVYFQSIDWHLKHLKEGGEYIAYGKPQRYGQRINFSHPEIETLNPENENGGYFQPIYNLTETLRKKHLDSRFLSKIMRNLLELATPHFRETLPEELVRKFRLLSKTDAMWNIHLPDSDAALNQALRRLKFEELFYNQLRLLKNKILHKIEYPGQIFQKLDLVKQFYQGGLLPFELTNAQKRVLREIHEDFKTGKQMNRLLQGDVGSGKTIVAFVAMLMAIDNGAQTCIMAPTEILADQHYRGLKGFVDALGLNIALLTGSTTKKGRKLILPDLAEGNIHIIVGTHALLEDPVQFKNLGLCIIDEQHRFGVAQRAKLWAKNPTIPPHVLVMTATPIPRTLAMTLYGDLDLSIIDELPAGRKPIKTVHRYDQHRITVFGFLREEIKKGRQIYIVYPLIEESEKLDYKDLMDGYESVTRAFPEYHVSIVHGKMLAYEKDDEMQRFVRGETHIMVATTVIEVGVNVPNASVMVIESAERFGLSQLHQLRGRVGRGAEQSYCILMTGVKLSKDTRLRIDTLCQTNNGFDIADVDLKLRGPGDLSGTQQSGLLDLLIADLAKDGEILKAARAAAEAILQEDTDLILPKNEPIRAHIDSLRKEETNWSRIS
ncbi:ATP-dependent DNA helicase RecG [Runella sp. MFBS21]|uniref:ATP-dependent DNA helicase RecG n=1 Tax=Runella sp. MFBS21 TaxID=3034018 RepID=UPI0023F977FF|nr:ATP-dependent DNA helicase RecG [Runella sp. MFBS21]MDF7820786.1 ATP-dependent DNA helicase RecG [Runella sp. MFBS21]